MIISLDPASVDCIVFWTKVSSRKDPSQRPGCGCVKSRDIGAYHTCLHGCRYCYAAGNRQEARDHYDGLDPEAPMLGRQLGGEETVDEAALFRIQ